MIYWILASLLVAAVVGWDWHRGHMSVVTMAVILPLVAVVTVPVFWAVAVRDVLTGGIAR